MSELRQAPDGQPTDSIRTCLQHSKAMALDWEREVADLTRRLEAAANHLRRRQEDVKLYEYQLAVRLAQDVKLLKRPTETASDLLGLDDTGGH